VQIVKETRGLSCIRRDGGILNKEIKETRASGSHTRRMDQIGFQFQEKLKRKSDSVTVGQDNYVIDLSFVCTEFALLFYEFLAFPAVQGRDPRLSQPRSFSAMEGAFLDLAKSGSGSLW
jgi:hypothetical protein